jgi:N-acetylmuramoyl-L-alanine amidase
MSFLLAQAKRIRWSLARFIAGGAVVATCLLAGCTTDFAGRKTFRTVVIDPGHGGHDSGAVVRGVAPEKAWTLALAYRVRDRLTRGGFRVVMTRTTDVFIPLDTRTWISNSQSNAVFISLHFNYSPNHAAEGLETYYYTAQSATLARFLHASMLRLPWVIDRGIKNRGFHVIRKNAFPAVLIENGFLTNNEDVRRLSATGYLDLIADRIYNGLIAYRGSAPAVDEGQ